ncbi:MAG: efflux RND transporter periplasmic adaptor subunit [Bacteroidales bacterium]|nr:efflux RND transporter periplasmic adaptor subunit [Bacteroidales bacterium]
MKNIKYLLLLFIAVLTACRQNEPAQDSSDKPEKHFVKTAVAEHHTYTPGIMTSGTVHASREANVGATLPGKVEQIMVSKGQQVKKGQLLALMSGEMLTQAQIERNALEKDYKRVKRLFEKGSVTQQKFDHVKAEYDASNAKVQMLKKNTEIRAPLSGVVTDFLVREGENYFFSPNLKPGYSMTSGIVQIMKINPVEVRFGVNEKDLPRIKPGQQVKIHITAFPDTVFSGTVTQMPELLSTNSRTGEVIAEITNKSRKILPGMSASIEVITKEESAVFVPLEALFRPQGSETDFVFVVKDNKVNRKPVKRIASQKDMVAVDGLIAGDEVITAGKEGLENGVTVTVKNK